MQNFFLTLSMQVVPTVARRGKHVPILIRNSAGNFILGSKHIYPAGISRLVGGGVEADEEPDLAAPRELEEETGLKAAPQDLIPLAKVVATITDQEQTTTIFTTYIYFFDAKDQACNASDDLDELVELSEIELHELIKRYHTLPKEIDPKIRAAWYDYGQLYGQIHQIALESWKAQTNTQA